MTDIKESIDITKSVDTCGDVCPMNVVKTKFAMKDMQVDEVIEVILEGGDPLKNVSRSVKEEGHQIIEVRRDGENFRILVKKGR